MLRAAVLIFGCLCITTGFLHGGVQTLVGGSVLVLGTLFERWRYHNRNASADGDWQLTGERFVDPSTGKNVEVLYDARSGERRYKEIGGGPDRV
jgi:hypothetical protein